MSPSLFQAHLLARKDDPQTSKDAAKKMVESGELSRQEKMVYDAILRYINVNPLSRITKGFTTKDIAKSMSEFRRYADYFKWYDICRKRFSGLERKGKIEVIVIGKKRLGATQLFDKIYKRRDGCRCWRLK